jgi:signal transduction histidine kinase
MQGNGQVQASANAEQVRLALRELITNALQHGKASTITVQAQAANGMAVLTVQDDGAGIDQADLAQLREAGATGTRRSGLGLPLVRAVARAHGGQLTIDSTAGQGSSVALALPLA